MTSPSQSPKNDAQMIYDNNPTCLNTFCSWKMNLESKDSPGLLPVGFPKFEIFDIYNKKLGPFSGIIQVK